MDPAGQLSEERVTDLTAGAGLDVERLRRDMADSAIEAYLDETRRRATDLGIIGTPALGIGDTPGAVGGARLRERIAEAGNAG